MNEEGNRMFDYPESILQEQYGSFSQTSTIPTTNHYEFVAQSSRLANRTVTPHPPKYSTDQSAVNNLLIDQSSHLINSINSLIVKRCLLSVA